MRIVSLNAWGGRLNAPLLAWIGREDPDVLCLQEVVHTPSPPADWLDYRDGDLDLPQRADLLSDIAAVLPHHATIFCPAARGPLWLGAVSVPSLWGIATFVRRSLPVLAQAQDFVHGRFSPDGFGAHPRARTAHALRLCDADAGREVCVAQMHGLRDLGGKADTPARAAQARCFRDLIARAAGPEALTVVCGDFNVEPASETFAILAPLGLTELVTSQGHAGTRTSHYPKPGRFADYMLVNDPEAVQGFEVVRDPEVSDHCPLVLTV